MMSDTTKLPSRSRHVWDIQSFQFYIQNKYKNQTSCSYRLIMKNDKKLKTLKSRYDIVKYSSNNEKQSDWKYSWETV